MATTRFSDIIKTVWLIFCRLILPVITIFILLLMPNFMIRHLAFDSFLFDWIFRFLLTMFFCSMYWFLPKLFEAKPGQWLWISADVLRDPVLLKGYYWFMTAGYGFGTAGFTFYAFSTFLPDFQKYRLLFAVINRLFFVISFIFRYQTFMKLAASQKI